MSKAAITVGFISLGCPKNLVDSQLMAESLLSQGLQMAANPESADVIVVNTCAFIADAREESLDTIAAACTQKANGDCRAVLVAGCLPQRYRERIQTALPDVDGFIGLDRIDEAGQIIRQVVAGQQQVFAVPAISRRIFNPAGTVVFSTGAHAFLKIAEGCNHGCAFCAIPGIRGKQRSRPSEALVQEARVLIRKGFREIDVIAQDIMAYGKDLEPPLTLPQLLVALAQIEGNFWLRLLYGYPSLLTNALLDAMAGTPAICNYLDIPVQHSHPEMLQAMRRNGTAKAVEKLPERIRRTLPQATLRTTALVGFPGETDAHFEHLRQYLANAAFDHLGVFCFSPEEGTPAEKMPAQIAPEKAAERQQILMQEQQQRVQAQLRQSKGREDLVLIDAPGRKPGEWRARNQGQAPDVDAVVWIHKAPPDWQPGMFARIIYTGFRGYDLLAKPAPVPDYSSMRTGVPSGR